MAILREDLIDLSSIAEVCDLHGIQPTMFDLWQKKLCEDRASVFERSRGAGSNGQAPEARKVEALEAKLRDKNEVLAELMSEHIAQKEVLASSEWRVDAARSARRGGRFHESLVATKTGFPYAACCHRWASARANPIPAAAGTGG
jgi:hypothetical protein